LGIPPSAALDAGLRRAPGSATCFARPPPEVFVTSFIWKNRVTWLVVIVLVGAGLDQWTKAWAHNALTREPSAAEIACAEPGARRRNPECRMSPRVTEHGQRVVVREVPVVDGVLSFKYAENPAAAFSMTGSLPAWFRRPFLLGVSTLACVGIAIWYLRMRRPDWAIMTAFPMIIAGALGNLIDRARLAYVIDFIDAYLSAPSSLAARLIQHFGTNHWPTFNIADMCIVGGAGLVILRTLRPLPDEEPTEASAGEAASPPGAVSSP
jgi:signal peptidase II